MHIRNLTNGDLPDLAPTGRAIFIAVAIVSLIKTLLFARMLGVDVIVHVVLIRTPTFSPIT